MNSNNLDYEKINEDRFKSRSMKIYLAYRRHDINKIGKLCDSNEVQGCFLSFKSLNDLRKRKNELSRFCANGDTVSCKYLSFVESKLTMFNKWENDSPVEIDNYLSQNILVDMLNHPTTKIRYFIQIYKYHLITAILIINIAFFFYILMLYKRSEDVFVWIRKKHLAEIKSKISEKLK